MTRREVTYDGITFAPGRRFRVVGLGAYLTGMKPWSGHSSAWEGFRQDLQVGDIITCTGYGPGFGSDPGYGVEWTTETARDAGAVNVEFRPMTGGMWAYHPFPGYLVPFDDNVVESTDTAESSFIEESS